MVQHIKTLAILNIVLGALGVLCALIVLAVFGGLTGLINAEGDPEGVVVMGLIGGVAFLIVALLSVPTLVAGIGLLNFKPWAKTLTLIVSALHLFNIPFGTALGIYGLWVLTKDETAQLIRAKNLA